MELLVVIAIIAVLAALLFPAGAAIRNNATRSKARTELNQIVAAIESYKAKYNHYPPDNPSDYAKNPLYFELLGVVDKGGTFESKDGSTAVAANYFPRGGFVNCTRGGGDDVTVAQKFISEIKPTQFGSNVNNVRVLSCSVQWPAKLGNGVAGVPELNPWRYNSSNPTNNPGGFDLWVDIYISGKTNRISNWSSREQIVY